MYKFDKKKRVDELLVELGLAESRSRAKALVLAGVVYLGTQRIDKPATLLDPRQGLRLKGRDHPYVSRGGVKLKAALDHFCISVKDCIGLDVGASTGGFTDCLIQEGAKKVYALDVGYGQLAWSLRKHPKVVVFERINFREFDQDLEPIDVVTMDVSFISVTKLLSRAVHFLNRGGWMIILIKPQFEVERKDVGKKGVVRSKEKIDACVQKVSQACSAEGLEIVGTLPSPILGAEGNQEILLACQRLVGRAV